MKQLQITWDEVVHDHEPILQDHLDANRSRFGHQCQQIYDHLLTHGTITSQQAWITYGIQRCASRVNDLKRYGIPVDSRMIPAGKTKVAEYYLITNP